MLSKVKLIELPSLTVLALVNGAVNLYVGDPGAAVVVVVVVVDVVVVPPAMVKVNVPILLLPVVTVPRRLVKVGTKSESKIDPDAPVL